MSSTNILLGIDLSSSVCKAAAVSVEGEMLSQTVVPASQASKGGRHSGPEAREWWRIAVRSARQALTDPAARDGHAIGLAISSRGSSFVPVDVQKNPISPATDCASNDAHCDIADITEHLSLERVFEITGKRPDSRYPLFRLIDLKKHQPDLYNKTARFLFEHAYVASRLAGDMVTDHSLASATLAHDVRRLSWSQEILEAAGISPQLFPSIRSAGTILGRTLRESAEIMGVDTATIIAVGGQSDKCAALGAGIGEGTVTVSLGTLSTISALLTEPLLDRQMRLLCSPFVAESLWVIEGRLSSAGRALAWLRNTLFPMDYPAIDALADQSFEGTENLFFYPHISGPSSPDWERSGPGAFIGITSKTESADVARSVLEGVAYQIRRNLEVFDELGVSTGRIRLIGGGARSLFWSRIIADVTARPVEVPEETDTAAIGACMLAGLACGAYSSIEEASVMVPRMDIIEPDPERSLRYQSRFARYQEMQKRLSC